MEFFVIIKVICIAIFCIYAICVMFKTKSVESEFELSDLLDKNEKQKCKKEVDECTKLLKGVTSDFDREELLAKRAKAYLNMFMFQEAASDYTAAIELNQRNADYYYNRALAICFDDKGNKNALNDINMAISLSPDSCVYFALRASIYFYDPQYYDNALADYKKCIELYDPQSEHIDDVYEVSSSYFSIAQIYFVRKQYDDALDCVNKAIQLSDKTEAKLLYYDLRAMIYSYMGEYKLSIDDYSILIKESKDYSGEYLLKRGLVYSKLNDKYSADADFQKVVKSKYTPSEEIARAYCGLEEYDKAFKLFQDNINFELEHLEDLPNLYRNYYYRAEAYYKKEDYDKALLDYKKALIYFEKAFLKDKFWLDILDHVYYENCKERVSVLEKNGNKPL